MQFDRALLFLLCCLSPILAGTARGDSLSLTLNGMIIGIDRGTGSLVHVSHPSVGTILSAVPESGGLLDAAYPIEAFAPLRLASRFSKARLDLDSGGLTITWDALGSSRDTFPLPAGGVKAEVRFKAAPDGKSIIISCRIENRSQASIPQVLFPDLRGLQPFHGIEQTRLRLGGEEIHPYMEPVGPPDSAPFYADLGWKTYPGNGQYALRWFDLGSLRGGLSMFQKEWGTPRLPTIRAQRKASDPASLRLVWEHRTEIGPGQSWESGEFWLTPHRGGWAKGIEVYREYVRQVFPPRELPRHVRDGLGFQTIWMIQTAETDPAKAAFRFVDLPRVARDAIEHGIDELVPWGWCTYSTMPIPLRTELGTQEEFLEGVRRAKDLGVNIAPFVSIQTVRNQLAPQYGARPGSGDWTYHQELIPNFRPYYTKYWDGAEVGSDNPAWQNDVLKSFEEWINRGVVSFGWDQFRSQISRGPQSELVTLVEKIRSLARGKDPQSTFGGEMEHWELDGQVLDYTWLWKEYLDTGPILNLLPAPRLNCNVEDSPLAVKKAFCDGLYINAMPSKPDAPNGTALIGEVPALARALKEVAPLRKQFLPFFVEGVFIGESVLSAPSPAFVRAHQMQDRLLVIVLNDRPEPQRVVIQSDLDLWLRPANAYEVQYYDGRGNRQKVTSQPGIRWLGFTQLLQPLELAFFEIRDLS